MSLQFYNDFFETNIMNHCEFLKTLPELGNEDIHLLKSMVGILSEKNDIKKITPFYNCHITNPKNMMCILESYNFLKDLKSHNFNIFEYAFLVGNGDLRCEFSKTNNIKLLSFFTLFFQYLIFIILVFFNIPSKINYDLMVMIITFGTSFFFIKLAHNQYLDSTKFNRCYTLTGDENKQIYLKMNFLSNVILPIIVPFFNIYYILLSEDPNNAILNSLALFFILELDSMILPSWSEKRVSDELAMNIHDYIMIEEDEEGFEQPTITKLSDELDHIHKYDEKTYVEVNKIYHKIMFYVRIDSINYKKIEYEVSGNNCNKFINLVNKFNCIKNYEDIHT